jgi:hypothetical protein
MNVRAALVRSARTSAEDTVITRSIHFATLSYCTKRRPWSERGLRLFRAA